MTKAITCAAAMQLVENGKLALDAPIGKLLPQLAGPQVLDGFDGNGRGAASPAKGPITLRRSSPTPPALLRYVEREYRGLYGKTEFRASSVARMPR